MAVKSLSELRNSRNSFEKLNKDIAANKTQKSDYADDTIWSCSQDDSKNGQAIIRFLPSLDDEEPNFVKMFKHSFKGPTNKWYIENCLTTIGQDDPCTESNTALWDTGTKENKELVQGINGKNARKRKTDYYSNILVISDPAKPECNGKVFKFKYGTKIFEQIESALVPEFKDDEPKNPFGIDDGYNFRLRMVQKDGYANFDKSTWADKPTPLADTDEEIEAILGKCYPLSEIIAPDKFKTYAELQKRLDLVLGNKSAVEKREDKGLSEDDETFLKASAKAPTKEKSEKFEKPNVPAKMEKSKDKIDPADSPDAGGDADDDMAYFARLANE